MRPAAARPSTSAFSCRVGRPACCRDRFRRHAGRAGPAALDDPDRPGARAGRADRRARNRYLPWSRRARGRPDSPGGAAQAGCCGRAVLLPRRTMAAPDRTRSARTDARASSGGDASITGTSTSARRRRLDCRHRAPVMRGCPWAWVLLTAAGQACRGPGRERVPRRPTGIRRLRAPRAANVRGETDRCPRPKPPPRRSSSPTRWSPRSARRSPPAMPT